MPRSNKVKIFTVYGRGPFPFDMLRYDHCYPVSSEDATKLYYYESPGKSRQIELRTAAAYITPERWASFGWYVVQQKNEHGHVLEQTPLYGMNTE